MAEKKASLFSKISDFFKSWKAEIKKVVWPTPKKVFKNTGVVLIVILIVGLFVFALDTGLMNLFGVIMSVSK